MFYGIAMILVGVGLAFVAFKDYDWFMNSRSPYFLKKLFGRNGARVVYIILGIIFTIMGILYLITGAGK